MIKLNIAHEEFVTTLQDQGKSNATVVAYKKDIEQLIDHLFKGGLNHVHEVELDHLETFMTKMAESGLTNKTISRKTNATKTFFRHLVENDHIQINVADQLRHPKVELKAPRIFSKVEYKALRDTAKDDIRTAAIIEVLLQTGVSIAELSLIELIDLEMQENIGVLTVPKRHSRDPRTVPLNKAVIEAIQKYINHARPDMDDSAHLFITKTGNALLVRNIRSTIDRYFKAAGITNAKVNDLRHTFIAHHLAQGTSLQTISKIAGHKRISTTEKYLQYITKETTEEKMELGIL